MQRDLTCPKCAGRIFWQVRGMREHGGGGRIPELAPAYEVERALFDYRRMNWQPSSAMVRLGRLDTLICRACGYCEWSAHNYRGGEPVAGWCTDCGSGRFGLLRMKNDSGAPEPVDMRVIWHGFPEYRWAGRFETRACLECGVLSWYARALELPEGAAAVHGVSAEESASGCIGCGGRRRWRIETVHGQGDRSPPPLRVLLRDRLFLRHEVGKFSVTICRECGHTDWWAREFGELSASAKNGVSLLQGTAHLPNGGPYR